MTTGPARGWRAMVPLVCLIAGVGFAVSARDSNGTDLRAPGIVDLADTVRAAEARVQSAEAEAGTLQGQVDDARSLAGAGDAKVARAQARVAPLSTPAGLTAVRGAGIQVVLDDASEQPAGSDVDPNQLVVHQSDLQAVVNALWAGGAEAMTIAGQRVIATSAVRCVGNTLLLNGDVYSPPFRVAAIGPSATMKSMLAASPGVKLFEQAAGYFGLGYTVATEPDLHLPAYNGTTTLLYARAAR